MYVNCGNNIFSRLANIFYTENFFLSWKIRTVGQSRLTYQYIGTDGNPIRSALLFPVNFSSSSQSWSRGNNNSIEVSLEMSMSIRRKLHKFFYKTSYAATNSWKFPCNKASWNVLNFTILPCMWGRKNFIIMYSMSKRNDWNWRVVYLFQKLEKTPCKITMLMTLKKSYLFCDIHNG